MILNDELNTIWAQSWASLGGWGGGGENAPLLIFLPDNNFQLLWSRRQANKIQWYFLNDYWGGVKKRERKKKEKKI